MLEERIATTSIRVETLQGIEYGEAASLAEKASAPAGPLVAASLGAATCLFFAALLLRKRQYAALGGAALAGGWIAYESWRFQSGRQRSFAEHLRNYPLTYDITEDGVAVSGRYYDTQIQWAWFDSWSQTQRSIVIVTYSGEFLVIPKRCLIGDRLENLLESKVGPAQPPRLL